MTVTHKERMRRALNHELVDRIPTQVNFTQAMGQRLAAHLGVTLDQLPQRLGNHLLRVDITHELMQSDNGHLAFDWWGVGYDTGLVLVPSHRLMTDTPMDNVEAMLDAFASLQVRLDAVPHRGQALDNVW